MKFMENFKNRIGVLVAASVALLSPLSAYSQDVVFLKNPQDYYPFVAMGIALLSILLIFAIIIYAINHKTKREKMHIELLTEMVKMGYIPTSEQVQNKSVTDAEISVDDCGRLKMRKRMNFSFPKILLIIVGVVWLFLAFNTNGKMSSIFGLAGMYVAIYAIMDSKNVTFLQRNMGTFCIINIIIGIAALFIGVIKVSNFYHALFTLYLPGGYLVYYAIKTLFLYEQMPSFEFKIKKVERRNGAVAGADEAPVHEKDAVNDNVEA